MEASRNIESINAKNDEGKEIIETLRNECDEEQKMINKLTISELIKRLSLRERKIIKLRYYNDKTQMQVANILGISQVHVSRIEKKILSEFREMLMA